jgi:hypothetical protein
MQQKFLVPELLGGMAQTVKSLPYKCEEPELSSNISTSKKKKKKKLMLLSESNTKLVFKNAYSKFLNRIRKTSQTLNRIFQIYSELHLSNF